ncbi:hypothetical protein [Halalkalicoccus subterraneus]|uniref:hypothetical protein n=1 Tax=Halalkalicoccus subterraneus TaxID=2675002 RepID=UPI000EFBA69A|nr:hypothetical protein [Halalkalicoccus subterraneus]
MEPIADLLDEIATRCPDEILGGSFGWDNVWSSAAIGDHVVKPYWIGNMLAHILDSPYNITDGIPVTFYNTTLSGVILLFAPSTFITGAAKSSMNTSPPSIVNE